MGNGQLILAEGSARDVDNYFNNTSVTVLHVKAGNIIPVTNITGLPTTTTVGSSLTLVGDVFPANVTGKDIKWFVKDEGGTGATITGNSLIATIAAGTTTLVAMVNNEESGWMLNEYMQFFNVLVINESDFENDVWCNGERFTFNKLTIA